ncbi:MAG: MFS transporter [Mesorhizobium sp.]|nr:MFS transporter [Mesorhizobium sp.]
MADLTLAAPGADTGRRSLILGTLGHTVNDAYTAFVPALLPMFHLQLGLDEMTLAALVAIFALSASLPGPFLGRLSDHFGEVSVTAASVLFSAVLLSLLVVAPSVPLLFALVAVAGLGSAAIHPAGSMLVRRGTARPELAIAVFAAGGMLGYAAGPSLLSTARDLAGAALPVVLAAPGVLAATVILACATGDRKREVPAADVVRRFDWRLVWGPVSLRVPPRWSWCGVTPRAPTSQSADPDTASGLRAGGNCQRSTFGGWRRLDVRANASRPERRFTRDKVRRNRSGASVSSPANCELLSWGARRSSLDLSASARF